MSHLDQHAYFSRRFADEMANGDQAATAAIAAIHYELAHRYALIVKMTSTKPSLTLVGGADHRSPRDTHLSPEAQRA